MKDIIHNENNIHDLYVAELAINQCFETKVGIRIICHFSTKNVTIIAMTRILSFAG